VRVLVLRGSFTAEVDMSEQGWRNFLAAHGGSDWVVLHSGATAVFRVQSVVEAARLAEAIAHIPGLDGAGVLMTIADGQLTVRLTRGLGRLEERHVQLAHAVSAVAREHGAVADRTRVQEVQLAISARPRVARVWRGQGPASRPSIRARVGRWRCRRPIRRTRARHARSRYRSHLRCTSMSRSRANRPSIA
jgi:hypothetical protein